MAVSFVGFASGNQQPGTGITVTKPAGTTSGDLLCWAVALPVGYTATPPTGATSLVSVTDGGGQYSCVLYTQTAGGSEPSSYTWTLSGSYWWSVELVVLRGAGTPTVFQTVSTGAATSVTWPTITIPAVGGYDMLIATGPGGTIGTPPTNYSSVTGGADWPAWETRLNPPTGATGALSMTYSSSSPVAGIHVFVPSGTGGGGGGTPPANTVLPTITGTPASGATITGHLGTWSNTPTSYSYEFRWLRDPTMIAPFGNPGYETIPGTAGTTSSSATAPTYVMGKNDASQSIVFHVTATNGGGSASADSTSVVFYGTKIPFKSTGSAFLTQISSSTPVYSTSLTSTLQTALTNYRAGGTNWWNQGGNYGDNFSVYIHRVDSSMTRTPFLLAGSGSFGNHDLRNPKQTAVQNGDIAQHLAWSIGVKNGGVPTPPGFFRVVGPNTSVPKDAHCLIYVEDTFELYEFWNTYFITPGQSTSGTPLSTDYDNQWVCFWGGYMRDVRENDGRWFGDKGFGSNRYRLDKDGNTEYAGWGGTATSVCLGQTTQLMKEVLVDSEIGHTIGFIFPGHLSMFQWPASREASGEPGGDVMQGGIFTIDPALNLAGLTSLGTPAKDAYRLRLLTAIQKFGAINMDSTGTIISVKQEAMGGTWPNVPNVDNQGGASMNEVLDSVPITSWKWMSPSWRPAGYVGNAKTATITETWTSINSARWSTGGSVSASGGQLTLSSTGSNTALWPALWASHSLVGSTLMGQTITMPSGATKNSFGIQPLNPEYNSPGLRFNIIGGNLRCEHFGWYAEANGTDVVVAFNATNHKWLRFRMNANHSVDWQVSPGGAGSPGTWTWTTLRTDTPYFDLEDANITYELTGPATTTAVWGLLNTSLAGTSFSRTATDSVSVSDSAAQITTAGSVGPRRRRLGNASKATAIFRKG